MQCDEQGLELTAGAVPLDVATSGLSGRVVACVSAQNVHVWSLKPEASLLATCTCNNMEMVHSEQAPPGRQECAAWHPDGRRLAVAAMLRRMKSSGRFFAPGSDWLIYLVWPSQNGTFLPVAEPAL